MTGYEPSISRASDTAPETTGNEPGLSIDAALLDLLLALNSNNPLEREAAIELFAEMGERALPALLRGLRANNRVAQLGAVRAIQLIADPVMIPHLMKVFGQDVWLDWALLRALLSLGEAGEQAIMEHFRRGGGSAIARQLYAPPTEHKVRQLERKLLKTFSGDLHQLLKLYQFQSHSSALQEALIDLGEPAAQALLDAFYNEAYTPWETSVLMLRIVLHLPNVQLCHQIINAIHGFYAQRRTLKNASNVEYWLWQVQYQHADGNVRHHAGRVRNQLRKTIHKGLRA